MIFDSSKYTRWYYQIINRAQGQVLTNDIYTKSHHIIPEMIANRAATLKANKLAKKLATGV